MDEVSLKEALEVVEAQTDYRFFFQDDWVADINVSVKMETTDVAQIVAALLEKTPLNYHFIDEEKRIILLQNTIVYDELPRSFLKQSNTIEKQEGSSNIDQGAQPTFYADRSVAQQQKRPPVLIGKAVSGASRSNYTLSGKVFNRQSGEVVPDLTIRHLQTNNVVITDEGGNYKLELRQGRNILKTRALGIQDSEWEIFMFNDGTFDFVLEEGLQQLEEVVVEADAVSNVKESETGTERIDLEESKNIPLVLGERDLLQVAKALPGISSAGEGATGLNVRGGKTDQNLVLLDDAVIYNPTHFYGIFQALNPFTTESVDIYKGSIPVEYGGRLSSVLDIKSIDGNVEEFSGEGSIGPVTGNLALEIPVKK
ncbi:MAG: carboxypeptidase-like regulatory domain-containing protein, partial [Bacteroidota bacterium]